MTACNQFSVKGNEDPQREQLVEHLTNITVN